MKNKKGWIRIVESFLSALLLIVVLVLIVNQQNAPTNVNNNVDQIYGHEALILRNTQLNYSLRAAIVGIADGDLPLKSTDSGFPTDLNSTINFETPSALGCESQICATNSACDYWRNTKTAIYSQTTLITSTLSDYAPRKLRLFCWEK